MNVNRNGNEVGVGDPSYRDLTVVRAGPGSRAYRDVLALRAGPWGTDVCDTVAVDDGSSEVYCAYVKGAPAGTIRVSRLCGHVACGSAHADAIAAAFPQRVMLTTCCAVVARPTSCARVRRALSTAAWSDQITQGVRIEMIDAHERHVPFFERLGYRLIVGSFFVHPLLAQPSYWMTCGADASRASAYRDIFAGCLDAVSDAQIGGVVPLCQCAATATRTSLDCECLRSVANPQHVPRLRSRGRVVKPAHRLVSASAQQVTSVPRAA